MITYTNALVTDAKDSFRVCHDKQLDIASTGHVKEVFLHSVLFREREVKTFTPPEEVRVVCDRISLYGIPA